jgi:predicted nucleic acid-binding Zn finger protein
MLQYIVQSLRFDCMVLGNCYLEEYNFDVTIRGFANCQRVCGRKVALVGLQVDIVERGVDRLGVCFRSNELAESLGTCKSFLTLLEAKAKR